MDKKQAAQLLTTNPSHLLPCGKEVRSEFYNKGLYRFHVKHCSICKLVSELVDSPTQEELFQKVFVSKFAKKITKNFPSKKVSVNCRELF